MVEEAATSSNAADSKTEPAVIPDVLAADAVGLAQDRLRYAVVDTGATETVGSMDALEHVLGKRFELFGQEDVVIDCSKTKEFKFGNGQTRTAASFVCLPQTIDNQSTTLGIYALDVPNVPILLGIKTLQKLGAMLDLEHCTLEFRKIFPGKLVQLLKGANGHLLLDLCSDWCMQSNTQDTVFTHSPHDLVSADAPTTGASVATEDAKENTDVFANASSEQPCHDSTEDSLRLHGTAVHLASSLDAAKVQASTTEATAPPKATAPPTPAMSSKENLSKEKVNKTKAQRAKEMEESLEWDRAVGPDARDPRLEGPPCHGHHRPAAPGKGSCSGSNKWAKWIGCEVCQLRLQYIPRVGAPGHRRSAGPLPRDVTEVVATTEDLCPSDLTTQAIALHGPIGRSAEAEAEDQERADHRLDRGEEGLRHDSAHGREESPEARGHRSSGSARDEPGGSGVGGDVSSSEPSRRLTLSESEFQAVGTLDDPSRDLLVQSLSQAEEDVVEVLATFDSQRVDLVEVCCGPNSLLAETVISLAGTAERLGLFNGYDLSTPQGYEKAKKRIAQLKPRWLWFSLPCGPTSNIQNLNERTPEGLAKSLKRKRRSRGVSKVVLALAKEHVCDSCHEVRLYDGGHDIPIFTSQGTPGHSMRENLVSRVRAEEVYRRSQAAQRISRALNRRLKRCSNHQVRHCSEREKLIAEASGGYMTYPWSFTDLIQKVGAGNYDDYDDLEGELIGKFADLPKTSIQNKMPRSRSRPKRPADARSASRVQSAPVESSASDVQQVPVGSSVSHAPRSEVSHDVSQLTQRDEIRTSQESQEPQANKRSQKPEGQQKEKIPKKATQAPETPRGSVKDNPFGSPRLTATKRSPSQDAADFDLEQYLQDPEYQPLEYLRTRHRPDRLASPGPSRAASRSHGRRDELHRHPPFVRAQTRQSVGEMTLKELAQSKEEFLVDEALQNVIEGAESEECLFLEERPENECAMAHIEVPLPETARDARNFVKNSTSWMVQNVKKSPEVKLSKLTPEQVKGFDQAKQVEINNRIREAAVEKTTGYIPASRVMRMRWVLVYKSSGAPKARMVIVGFEDPDLLELRTSSSTMPRRTRQMILVMAATMGWPLLKGDVKSAFLQGASSQSARNVYAWPTPELATALGTTIHQPVKLLKACYGLVNAPAEWHRTVQQAMREAGFEALATEPCCWRLMVPDGKGGERVAGLCATHVDDFLFCGDENEPKYRNALTYLYEKFIWTLWEDGNFEHCGIDLIRHSDDRFVLDHSKFCDKLDQVVMEKEIRADHEPASENEKAQLRGLLGSIQWRVIQSAPQHAAQLSMLQTEMANATVKTIRDANKLCREVVHDKNAVMTISPLKVLDPTEVCFVAWSDAALGNRPNGGSTGGYVVAATSPDLLEGKPATLNFVAWRSGRLPRVARSSLAAEVQAFSEAEEELMWCRLQWAEMCGKNVPLKQPETIVASVKGVMVTDAKSLYDVIQKGDQATSGMGLKEKYSALEIMSVVQRLELCKTMTRWVHSDAQIADALTKRLSTSALKRVLSVNTWTLVEDPTFTSAKRLKRGDQ
eukprot:s110_g22.t1